MSVIAIFLANHPALCLLILLFGVSLILIGGTRLIWPYVSSGMRTYRIRWPIERREIEDQRPLSTSENASFEPPYVGRIYIDFQHISENQMITINLTCKNVERSPVKVSTVDGYIVYEGDARHPRKPQELSRVSLANPFETEWWPGRSELYVQLDQGLPRELAKTLKEGFDLGTPLKFRLAFLNVWFTSKANTSERVRLPVWTALQCTKSGERTDVVELNEAVGDIVLGRA